ncbi:hypothetical protein niasHS_007455 [Heterodera schachtii]|uniref:Uncharacterized protein n=1 Tax=Heterodera schachtii TaxID=97005 RepID=A0ABD2JXI7_HETSC
MTFAVEEGESLLLAEDLSQLDRNDAETIHGSICARYERKKRFYSRIGFSDLLALTTEGQSPTLAFSDPSLFAPFLSSDRSNAHIFATASQTLNEISGDGKEAAIVFCGEAGAGKTTNLFNAIRFLAFAEEKREKLGKGSNKRNDANVTRNLLTIKTINALEKILGAFGAAKTLKNEQSNLHGYAIELHYEGKALVGLSFMDSPVPLELSRIIGQRKGEGNFNVFYQLCEGINPKQREMLGLSGVEKYFYLNQGNCRRGVGEKADFAKLADALSQVGFSDHQKTLIWRLLATILHIGNLFFVPQKNAEGEENLAEIANGTELQWAAVLLQIDFDQLERLFTHSEKDQRLTVEAALDVRDAFAQMLYYGLFQWILSRISLFLRPASSKEKNPEFVGVSRGKILLLDLPGPRRYNANGFEEFCINLANERLELFFQQQRFGHFKEEQLQNVFASRGGDFGLRNWPNSERTMELLVKRPMGIVPLLDDECKFPRGAEESFLQHCNLNHLDNPIYAKARVKGRLEFGIRHYFGFSFYSVSGILNKNRFIQPPSILAVLSHSKDTSMASIFEEMTAKRTTDRWESVANEWHKGIVKLCEQIKNFRLHFVRCIRAEMTDDKLNPKALQRQLRILSVSDHCLAVRHGFQHKIPIKKFADLFHVLLPEEVVHGLNSHQIAKDILDAQGIRYAGLFEFIPGHLFLMESLFAKLCQLKQSTLTLAALIIQKNFRKFLARQHFLLKRTAAIQIQAAFRGWKFRKMCGRKAWTEKKMKSLMEERLRGGAKKEEQREITGDEESDEGGRDMMRTIMKMEDMEEERRRETSAMLNRTDYAGRKAKAEQTKWALFRECSDYVRSTWPPAKAKGPSFGPTIAFEQFAEQIKTVPIGARREPIIAPFLATDSEEEFVQSLDMFKLVLSYQFQPEGIDPRRLALLAKVIVRHGILFPALRDELFLQLINQTHNSKCRMALGRAWTLLTCAINAFFPSEAIIGLLNGLVLESALPSFSAAFLKFRSLSPSANVRHFAPSLFEYFAFVQRRPFALLAQFVTGESLFLETDAWKTAEEMAQTMLRKKGIGDSFGWCFELDDGTCCIWAHSSLFLFDAIAQTEENRHIFPDKFGTKPPLFVSLLSPKSLFGEKCEKETNDQNWPNEMPTDWRNGTNPPKVAQNKFTESGGFNHLYPYNAVNCHTQSERMEHLFCKPSAVIQTRLDDSVHLRRSSNTKCMSRITEREEDDGMSTNGTEIGGEKQQQQQRQRQNANRSRDGTLGLIRNMPVPTSDGGVDRFLDDVFERALPPVDYDLEDNTDEVENEFPKIGTNGRENAMGKLAERQNANLNGRTKRFVYKTGEGIFEDRRERREEDGPGTNVKQQNDKTYQTNGQLVEGGQRPMANGAREKKTLARPTAAMLRKMAEIGFGIEASSQHIRSEEGRYEEIFNKNWRQFGPLERQFENEMKTDEEREGTEEDETEESATDDDEMPLDTHSEETALSVTSANEWVADSEFTLNDLLFNSGTQTARRTFSAGEKSHSSMGKMPKIEETDNQSDLLDNHTKKMPKSIAAISYAEQPFSLVLCRDLFVPGEVLDDASEVDLVFAQIIRDCRRQLGQLRIRRYEREAVQQLLRSFNVPPNALDKPATIPANVKLELIDIVRKWPLYFCRFFPVVEERPSGRFPQLLGISESGIRLISVHSSRNVNNEELKMTIQDHFEWCDIAEFVLENGDNALRIVTRQNIAILISGQQMAMVKKLIENFVIGGAKRRRFAVAVSSYGTRQRNILSFEAGDYIQLIDQPHSEMPSIGGQWLFGKLDGRFGWFPVDYVSDAEEHCPEGMGEAVTGGSAFAPFGGSLGGTAAFDYPFAGGIPQALEALFVDFDPNSLFLLPGSDRFTLFEFASHFFRCPKNTGAKNARLFGDWKELAIRVTFSNRPIAHSLLRLEIHEADRVAQQSFLIIMRFMGDEQLKRHQSFTDCVYELLSLCHIYVPIRDEIYCQILKQITENKSEKCAHSALRGWRLLSILCAYFPCSDAFKPFLVKFLGDVAFNAKFKFTETAKVALYNLAQTYRFGGRRLILSASEVEAIANGRNVRRQWYHLPGGHRRRINTRQVTVAEEIVRTLCGEMNIRSVAEQQEFSLCYILLKDNSMHTLLNDEYVMDVCTELETRGDDFVLILTRSVWLHPIRRECDLCTDALFFQLLPNYLAGLPVSLRADGSATAALLEDMAILGALLVLSAHQNDAKKNDLSLFVPKNVLNSANRILSHDQWLKRIFGRVQRLSCCLSPAKARQRFLEIIERWHLFGAAFYFVRRVYWGRNESNSTPGAAILAENCVLAVNKFGLRVLSSGTHHILAEFALDGIGEMAKYSISDANFFEIRFTTQSNGNDNKKSVTVETDLGNEISRLIGHYIFLNGGAAKFN